jgi:probable addiction module antidote protein
MARHPDNERDFLAVRGEVFEALNEAFSSRDVVRISEAIGNAAKANNIAELARRAKLARPSVYRAFAGGSACPNLTTVVRVLEALGLELRVERIGKNRKRSSRG